MIRKTDLQATCLKEDGLVSVTGSSVADLLKIVELLDGQPESYMVEGLSWGQPVVLKPTPFHQRKPRHD